MLNVFATVVFLFCSDFSQSVGVTQTIGVSARSTGSLPHTSPWDKYFLYIYHVDVHLAIYFWTRANDVFAIERECLLIMMLHVCTHNALHITNFMIHISPTDVSPVLSCICGIAAKILLNSQQLVVLSQSLRSENTHNCLSRWLKGCARESLVILVWSENPEIFAHVHK